MNFKWNTTPHSRTRAIHMDLFILVFLIISLGSGNDAAINLDECRGALGMESGAIKDEDINATSSYVPATTGPTSARLNKEQAGGAWCPKPQISKDSEEWLEVALQGAHVVSGVATQGRFGNGQGLEYAEEYRIEYWRPGLTRWLRYRDAAGQDVVKGNTNTYQVVKNVLKPAIIATRIRFVPFSFHLRTVCMRVEIFGCPYTDGVVSYAMAQGERRGAEVDLSDATYDGTRDDSYLHGGLGQLTDGVVGPDNFKQDLAGMGRGYDWVGWKNDSKTVVLLFEFDAVRNFSAMYLWCNNMHSREVQVFSSARIWPSVGGRHFLDPPLAFSYMPDLFFEKARNVTVHLHHRLGRFLKVELAFASRWMLISEVAFSSTPVVGNFTEEEEPPVAPPIVSTAMSEDALSPRYVGPVIGVLAAVIALLALIILAIVARHRHRRKHATPHLKHHHHPPGHHDATRVTINMKDLGLSYSQCTPLTLHSNGSIYGHQVILDDTDPDKLLYQDPQDFKYAYHGYSNESTISREYAVPDVTKTTNSTPIPPINPPPTNKPSFPQTLPRPLQKPSSERYYAATNVLKMPNLQGVSGNTVYAAPTVDLMGRDDVQVKEIPRHRLHYIEKMGEGQFEELRGSDLPGDAGVVRNEVPGVSELRAPGPGDPQLPGGTGALHQDRRLRHEPRPVLGSLLPRRGTYHAVH